MFLLGYVHDCLVIMLRLRCLFLHAPLLIKGWGPFSGKPVTRFTCGLDILLKLFFRRTPHVTIDLFLSNVCSIIASSVLVLLWLMQPHTSCDVSGVLDWLCTRSPPADKWVPFDPPKRDRKRWCSEEHSSWSRVMLWLLWAFKDLVFVISWATVLYICNYALALSARQTETK